jgi:hypothetical protein
MLERSLLIERMDFSGVILQSAQRRSQFGVEFNLAQNHHASGGIGLQMVPP